MDEQADPHLALPHAIFYAGSVFSASRPSIEQLVFVWKRTPLILLALKRSWSFAQPYAGDGHSLFPVRMRRHPIDAAIADSSHPAKQFMLPDRVIALLRGILIWTYKATRGS